MDELSKRSRELLGAFADEAKPSPARTRRVWANVARGIEIGHAPGSSTPSTAGSPLGVLVATGFAAVVGWGAVQGDRVSANSERSSRPTIDAVERAGADLVEDELDAAVSCESPFVGDPPSSHSEVEASTVEPGPEVRRPTGVRPKSPGGASRTRSDSAMRDRVVDDGAPADDSGASNRLAAEIASLAELRLALRAGRFSTALELVERHRAEFPDGALVEEAHVLHFDALCGSRNTEAAEHTAGLYLARWPDSTSSARIRRGCADASLGATKEDSK